MLRHLTISLIAAALVSTATSRAVAQERLDLSSSFEISPHGGLIILDDLESNEFFAGGTALIHVGGGLAIGATVDWAATSVEFGDDDLDASRWYYSGEIWYGLPSVTRAQFYGALGGGLLQVKPGGELEDAGVDDETHVMVPIELGVRWMNDKSDPDWGALLQFRNRIVYRSEEGEDTKVTNNWSIGLGLSLLIGG